LSYFCIAEPQGAPQQPRVSRTLHHDALHLRRHILVREVATLADLDDARVRETHGDAIRVARGHPTVVEAYGQRHRDHKSLQVALEARCVPVLEHGHHRAHVAL
jgi:hypothetical protein